MINDASVVIGGGNWGIKEADVLGYKLINNEYYARDIDFANSTAAGTYTDSTGVVRKAPYNLLQYSEQFDNAAWFKTNSTVTANTTTAPNGTLTADTINITTSSGFIRQFTNIGNSLSYSYSVYVKKSANTANNNFIIYYNNNIGNPNNGVFNSIIDLTNLTITTIPGGTLITGRPTIISSNLTSVGDGWYRAAVSFTTGTNAASSGSELGLQASGTVVEFLAWGAQLVEGTEALPYFPTTTRLNVPRIDYRNADGSLSTTGRLLLEPQRTNSIRNSSMVGAVAGTPGTNPTNWDTASIAGLSRTVVGIGTESGLPYIDLRFAGTATSSIVRVSSEAVNQIAATNGQTWASSSYMRRISGTYDSSSIGFVMRTSAVASLGALLNSTTLTTTLQRFVLSATTNNASVAFVQPCIDFNVTIGQSYDFTVRIAAPQMELGAYATTWIPTTTAAVTRNADQAIRNDASYLPTAYPFTLFADVYLQDTVANFPISFINTAASNNYFSIEQNGNIWYAVSRPNVTVVSISATATTAIGRHKVAAVFSSTTIKLFLNGSLVASGANTQAFNSSINDILIGQLRTVTDGGQRTPICQSMVLNFEPTDAQLIQLTTL